MGTMPEDKYKKLAKEIKGLFTKEFGVEFLNALIRRLIRAGEISVTLQAK